MDLLLIELVLWAGLLFFFWALKDGLGKVESDLESLGLLNGPAQRKAANPLRYARPEKVMDPIGSYKDAPIYRYAFVNGRRYQFDRVLPPEGNKLLKEEEFYLEPGLVYVSCDDQRPSGS